MPVNQKKDDNSQYKFIQEKIVPSKRKKWKKLITMVLVSLLLGVVFGLGVTVTLCLAEPWIAEKLGQEEMDHAQTGQGTNVQLPGDPDDDLLADDPDGDPANGDTTGTDDPDAGQTTDGEQTDPEGNDGQQPGDTGSENSGGSTSTQITFIEKKIDGTIADYQNMYKEISLLAEKINQSVVKVVSVTNGVDWFQNPYATEEETAGLILAVDESMIYILVNYEHIGQAGEIRIDFPQNVSATATFLDADTDVNLAVVTVSKADLPKRIAVSIEAAPLGESYSLNVGEPVMALGNPNGHMYSMLLGIVTTRESYAYIADSRLSLFHTDMELSEAGEGIVVNMNGKVVGLITKDMGEEPDLCTALSISRIRPLLEKMINQTPRIYMGIVGMDLSATLMEQLDVPGGVYVSEVESGSPAAMAGIRAGDVILQINGDNVLSITAFSNNIQERLPGDTVTLNVCRMIRADAVTQEYTVTLEQKTN